MGPEYRGLVGSGREGLDRAPCRVRGSKRALPGVRSKSLATPGNVRVPSG